MKKRKFKRVLSAVLSTAMCCSLMTANSLGFVYATETPDTAITVTDGDEVTAIGSSLTVENAVAGHTYRVYQIFTGNVSADGKTLSNVKYGKNYGETGRAVPDSELEGITDAKAFAKNLTSENTGGGIIGNPVTELSAETPSAELEPGYYLVMDTIADGSESENDAASDFIVEIVGNATFTPKSTSVPTFDKMIEGEVVCEHVWTETITKEPTCTEDGEKKLVCDECGEKRVEKIPAGHDYEDGVCKNCGDEEFVPVTLEELVTAPKLAKKPALSMANLSDVKINDESVEDESFDVEGVEIGTLPSGEDDEEYVLFKESGDYKVEADVVTEGGTGNTTIIVNIYITINNNNSGSDIHVHEWKETIVKEPTCKEEGEKKLECEGCGEVRTEVIPAKGHDYDDDGFCKDCGEHDHNYVETITKEPTCSEDGEKTYTCDCGDSYTEAISATGEHDYEEMITKEPTCSEDGEKELVCKDCGDTKTEVIPA